MQITPGFHIEDFFGLDPPVSYFRQGQTETGRNNVCNIVVDTCGRPSPARRREGGTLNSSFAEVLLFFESDTSNNFCSTQNTQL